MGIAYAADRWGGKQVAGRMHFIRFLRGQSGAFATLERWQTNYLPVYAAWAAIVVIVFPLVFGYN